MQFLSKHPRIHVKLSTSSSNGRSVVDNFRIFSLIPSPVYAHMSLSLCIACGRAGESERAERRKNREENRDGRNGLNVDGCRDDAVLLPSSSCPLSHAHLCTARWTTRSSVLENGELIPGNEELNYRKKKERKGGEKGRFSFGHPFPPLVSPARTPRTIFRTRESFGFSKEWKDTRNIPRKSMSDKYVHR